jgi:transcriptional regulator with XRE-family HTH domain
MSQEVLAGLVGRSIDWLSKVENNRIELDRLSVIRAVATALGVSVGDLVPDVSSSSRAPMGNGDGALPAIREALTDYRIVMAIGYPPAGGPSTITQLAHDVAALWEAYQASRFTYVASRLPWLLARAQTTADHDGDRARAHRLLGLSYQLAAVQLTKFGEAELALVAAERGLIAARQTGDVAVHMSLARSVVHALLSLGRCAQAIRLAEAATSMLRRTTASFTPEVISVYGTLFLAGAIAAARAGDRSTTRSFLAAAEVAARRLGGDANYLWTAFGTTNVAIHRVAVAGELGDVQTVIDLGVKINASSLPLERRVRNAIELARAYSSWNRSDDALATLLDAERMAPEQVHHHYLSKRLVVDLIRRRHGTPSATLVAFAKRLNV